MEAKEYNFWSLIEEYRIVFPRIQRDYAQGRVTFKAMQVRHAFLSSLHEALKLEKAEVNLDFIYGIQKKEIIDVSFSPLDGQQRLTTLFLLYWYLAYKTNNQDNLRQHLSASRNDEIKVRFLYDTRDSAKAFCEQMIVSKVENPNYNNLVSWNVKNQSWFLTMWTEDPTVQGMLTMLDAMDGEFKNDNDLLFLYYKKLAKRDGFIRFYVLPFNENYTLGDDLYVKMNARGLALTTFENFKASFEEELLEGDNKKSFIKNIDTLWTNMFWYPLIPRKGNPPAKVDNEMMRFVRLLLSFRYALRQDSPRNDEQSTEDKNEGPFYDEKIFSGLRVNASGKDFIPDEEQNYAYLIGKEILGKDEASHIVEGFETIGGLWDENNKKWKDNANPINLAEIWETFCKKPDYECQLLIWAVIIAPQDNNKLWFRLCRNLIRNTIINDKNDLRWLIVKLYELKKQQNFGL